MIHHFWRLADPPETFGLVDFLFVERVYHLVDLEAGIPQDTVATNYFESLDVLSGLHIQCLDIRLEQSSRDIC
jgi:hypothetical protein